MCALMPLLTTIAHKSTLHTCTQSMKHISLCFGANSRRGKSWEPLSRGMILALWWIWSMACSALSGLVEAPKDRNRTPNAPAWTKTSILMLIPPSVCILPQIVRVDVLARQRLPLQDLHAVALSPLFTKHATKGRLAAAFELRSTMKRVLFSYNND